jgi:hypothetical protein
VLFPFFLAVGSAFLFYFLLPVIGAFRVRGRWRRFRESLIAASCHPPLRYRDLAAGLGMAPGPASGSYTMCGIIEAFEGERLLWVRGQGVSAAVDLGSAPLYVLSSVDDEVGRKRHPAGSVERHTWSSIRMLSEGTRIFVAGHLSFDRGKPLFVDRPGEPLIAIAYDCPDGELVGRAVAGARHPNEYWNPLTRVSLILGLVAGSLILLVGAGSSPFPTVRALSFLAAASPALPFLPPGLFLFFADRQWWRRALERRIERDLASLHAARSPGRAEAARIRFARRAAAAARLAGTFLIGSVLLNAVMLFYLWRAFAG